MPRNSNARQRGRRLALALQGGGAHGAYTWGVLDRLVEEPTLSIDAVSGTSAGAMNAALLVDGLARGGPDGARRALQAFWEAVSREGDAVFNPWRYLEPFPALRDLTAAWGDALARLWSPYDNLAYRNPLADILGPAIDWTSLARARKPRLFVCATDVLTNEREIFTGAKVTVEALLASACLPKLFQAIEMPPHAYWDGGYMGNPALDPLLPYADDLLIVEVNALKRASVPRKAADIAGRLDEVAFNSALVQEIRGIETINKLVRAGSLTDPKYRAIRFHTIAADHRMTSLDATTKYQTDLAFLRSLHDLGYAAASAWLADPERYGAVGVRSSIDVKRRYCALAKGREAAGSVSRTSSESSVSA